MFEKLTVTRVKYVKLVMDYIVYTLYIVKVKVNIVKYT